MKLRPQTWAVQLLPLGGCTAADTIQGHELREAVSLCIHNLICGGVHIQLFAQEAVQCSCGALLVLASDHSAGACWW